MRRYVYISNHGLVSAVLRPPVRLHGICQVKVRNTVAKCAPEIGFVLQMRPHLVPDVLSRGDLTRIWLAWTLAYWNNHFSFLQVPQFLTNKCKCGVAAKVIVSRRVLATRCGLHVASRRQNSPAAPILQWPSRPCTSEGCLLIYDDGSRTWWHTFPQSTILPPRRKG